MKKIAKIVAGIMTAVTLAVSASVCASASDTETAYDSQFLSDMGICSINRSVDSIDLTWRSTSNAVDEAWRKVGITSVTCFFSDNSYWLDGREITRKEAFRHAADVLGKEIDRSKYYFLF